MSTVGVFVLVTCVISVIKFLDKTDRRRGWYLGSPFKGATVHIGKREREAAGHIVSTAREQREKSSAAQLRFPFLIQENRVIYPLSEGAFPP